QANFSYMKVGKFKLENGDFSQGTVFMTALAATDLDLRDIKWPPQDRLICEDMTYGRISVVAGNTDVLEQWPALSRYSSSTYATLASYLDNHANPEGASTVRVYRQWREAEHLDRINWLWNRLKFWTSGYGERPWYSFVWIGAFVAFGWWLFRHKSGMELA